MLAIGRALMSEPRAILLDEPSLGLAPMVVDRVLEVITKLRTDLGLTVLLVEQAAVESIELADYVYVLEAGTAIMQGPAAEVATDETLQRVFLGA
jgi:branched-chain amino acid transport system ATP-binding protein